MPKPSTTHSANVRHARANSLAPRAPVSLTVAAATVLEVIAIYRPALSVDQRTLRSNERPAISRSCPRGEEIRKRSERDCRTPRRSDGWKRAMLPLYSLWPPERRVTRRAAGASPLTVCKRGVARSEAPVRLDTRTSPETDSPGARRRSERSSRPTGAMPSSTEGSAFRDAEAGTSPVPAGTRAPTRAAAARLRPTRRPDRREIDGRFTLGRPRGAAKGPNSGPMAAV